MTKTLEDLQGSYGQGWRQGILTDHAGLATEAGAVVRIPRHGKATYLVPAKGGAAIPVLCGEIVMIHTEDGPIDGRCGNDVPGGAFTCEAHGALTPETRVSYEEYNAPYGQGWMDDRNAQFEETGSYGF